MRPALEAIAVACSPYPLVDLGNPAIPDPGQTYSVPRICRKAFASGRCESFYRSLDGQTDRCQCPQGFSVWPVTIGTSRFAVTAVIGAPRLGGDAERARAKEYPHNHVAADRIPEWAQRTASLVATGEENRDREFASRFDAIHGIRRLNQIVKTNVERVCNSESPDDPDEAREELVRAFRASSLMSFQLDALDLLANPTSAMSFIARPWVFYKVVDKLVRIYRVIADDRNVKLTLSGNSKSEALIDNRTIHIVPSVFIDNAVKYSLSGGCVDVHVADEYRGDQPVITVEVISNGPAATDEEKARLFLVRGRGATARFAAEGSGVGLTLARIVAEQHKGWISAEQGSVDNGRAEWRFRFQIQRASAQTLRVAHQRH